MSIKVQIPFWRRVKGKLEDADSGEDWKEDVLLVSLSDLDDPSILAFEGEGLLPFTVNKDDLEQALRALTTE